MPHDANAAVGDDTDAESALAATSVVPSVAELARALKGDPVLIYEYVRNNIAFYPGWGIKKGPVGTLIDQSGNALEIAVLTRELLRESGFSTNQARIVSATIELTPEQASNWLGLSGVNRCAMRDIFANSGVPVAVDSCSSGMIRITHFLLRVTHGTTTYSIDPSFKTNVVKNSLPNLGSILSYDQSSLISSACSGTSTCTSTAVSGIHRSNILAEAPGNGQSYPAYAKKLLSYLRANAIVDIQDVVGGSTVEQKYSSELPTALPYAVLSGFTPVSPGGIWKSRIRVIVPGRTTYLFTDAAYGGRLTISFDASNRPEVRLDGDLQGRGTAVPPGTAIPVEIRICHPNAAGSNCMSNASFDDPIVGPNQSVTQTVKGGSTSVISLGLGPSGASMISYQRQKLSEAQAAGGDPSSEPILGQALMLTSAAWIAQTHLQAELALRLGGAKVAYYHQIGITGHYESPYVDLPGNMISIATLDRDANGNNNPATLGRAFLDEAMHGSTLESSAVQQINDIAAVSTAKLLDIAMSVTENNTLFDLKNISDFDTYKSQLVNYGLESDPGSLLSGIKAQISSGRRVILPKNGALTEFPGDSAAWKGAGYYVVGKDQDSGLVNNVAAVITGGMLGGFGSLPQSKLQTVKSSYVQTASKVTGFIGQTKNLVADPVDGLSGDYVAYYTDLTTGVGAFPSSLSFERGYSSGRATATGPLGRGWTHNLDITARVGSDGFRGMGSQSAWEAAAAIAEKYVSLQLLSDPTLPLKNVAVASIGHRWMGDKLIHNVVNVNLGLTSETFATLVDGTFSPQRRSASRLALSSGVYTLTNPAGERLIFNAPNSDGLAAVDRLETPSGLKARFVYSDAPKTRLASVTNSFGRQLSFGWTGDRLTSLTETGLSPARSVAFAYSGSDLRKVTNPRGKVWLFCTDSDGRITRTYTPTLKPSDDNCAAGTPFMTNSYDTLGRVMRQVDGEGHVTDHLVAGARSEMVQDPDGLQIRSAQYYNEYGEIVRTVSPRGKVIETRMNGFGQPIRIVYPEGNAVELKYDIRSNLVQTCRIAKPPVGQTAPPCDEGPATQHIITRATYGEGPTVWNCSNPATCNLPATVTNERGFRTDFSYNANGTPASVEGAALDGTAPVGSGTRPRTSFGYTTFTASADQVSLPTSQTERITSDSNTLVTTTTYEAANRFVVKTTTVDPSGLALTTTYTSNAIGDVTAVDGPRTDVTDIVTTEYNASRLPTLIIGPSAPDPAIARIDYDDDDKVRATASRAGAQWLVTCSLWSKSGQQTASFGPKLVASDTDCSFGADAAVTRVNTSYDAADRPVFTSAPNGSDARTTRTHLLADGLVGSVVEAEGTPVARTSAAYTYSDNGLPLTLTDSRGNKTAYEYDGFDRLHRLRHPTVGNGGVPSSTDYAEFTYDKAGNIVSERRRDGQMHHFTWNNQSGLKLKDVPEANRDVTYVYDLIGRLTSATLPGANASLSVSFTYDKIGRVLTTASGGNSLTYTYQPAGAWSATAYPGSLTVTTCYDAAGRVARIKEASNCANDTGLLARYAWDAASRRTTVTLGNGTTSGFTYDAQGRLESLSHDLSGTASDVTWGQSYNRVGQITTSTRSNDAYAWKGHYNVKRPYTTNALDQYSKAGNSQMSWDGLGNLSRTGPNVYVHDSENRLVSGRGVPLTWDALGRLVRVGVSTAPPYLYDGDELVAEFDAAGTAVRRHVHGPGVSEPIVTYEGSAKTWLYADIRGSIVGVANASGVATRMQGYGQWGEPNADAAGRFGFTGQLRLHEVSPDLYKLGARIYSSRHGRFIEPDPIGTTDDINLYSYVANDPINLVDPTGMFAERYSRGLDSFQTGLDFAGFVPGLGAVPDLLNAGIYTARGQYGMAALSAVAAVPFYGDAVKGAAMGGKAAGNTVTLYRAVSPAELANLSAHSGAFKNPRGIEVKYFSETAEGAASYAQQAYRAGGSMYQGPYTIVKTSIDSNLITPVMRATPDRGIPTVTIPTKLLPRLKPAQNLPFSPVPRK